ncbi:translation initiation factor [uncultured Capnocytophaga sp.]|jgi:translation initiation factor SUI1|uniref:translation initiation factor n=1 Tax=uncultured Capnocytophaga sp. TaxID=159273 RepID=UPI0028EC8EC3|nr:translation initiation factor [uncultured Capnocytophaga sp.]
MLREQLQKLFPDHKEEELPKEEISNIWLQDEPLLCKYEKRNGKSITLIEGYTGADNDFKILAKELKTFLGVGGTVKEEKIMIQGDYRDKVMDFLKKKGFKVKRVGG